MKRRPKRIAFTVAATGLTVVTGLGVTYRAAVRDHVEAWHFQLTTETETIEADPAPNGLSADINRVTALMFSSRSRDFPLNYLDALASSGGCPVIFAHQEIERPTFIEVA